MFESIPISSPVDAEAVPAFARGLRDVEPADEQALVAQLTAIEGLKSAAAARQARLAEALDRAVRAREAASGLPADEQGRGVAAQVALARRESPVTGGRHLGLAKALVREMPHTLAVLEAGHLSEWRATLLVRETACLSREDRAAADHELCSDPGTLAGLGDRGVADATRRVAYRLDPQAFVARAAKADKDRRVTLRPAPDTMSFLTGHLPVAQGVAAFAALTKAADEARAAGDPRTRAQVMADEMVQRITGQAHAEQVPLEVEVVLTDRHCSVRTTSRPSWWATAPSRPALPATWWPGPSELPCGGCSPSRRPDSWWRWSPARGTSRAGCGASSGCGTRRVAGLGATRPSGTATTSFPTREVERRAPSNGQGLCESCNYTKELLGWSARAGPTSRPGNHVVETITPTGHAYRSRAPSLHSPPPRTAETSLIERRLARVVLRLYSAA